MTHQSPAPRKRRTREHIIADQSVNFLERFIIDEGHVAERVQRDYGYDLIMMTFDEQGYAEPDQVRFQVKAAESLQQTGEDYIFDIDVRDYNLWMSESMPVILVLFDASRRRAFWIHVQNYFEVHPELSPKQGTKTVRIHVPDHQKITRSTIAKIRKLKQ